MMRPDTRKCHSACRWALLPGLLAGLAAGLAVAADWPDPLPAVPLSTLSATRDRPLFSPSRRPAVPAVAAAAPVAPPVPLPAPPPEPDHPLLALMGTITRPGAGIGIFREPNTQAVIRLVAGQDYKGWRLAAVRQRETEFARAEQTAILALPQPQAAAAGASSPSRPGWRPVAAIPAQGNDAPAAR